MNEKVYLQMNCAEHGASHSLEILQAVRADSDVFLSVCEVVNSYREIIEKIYGIRVLKPSELLKELDGTS